MLSRSQLVYLSEVRITNPFGTSTRPAHVAAILHGHVICSVHSSEAPAVAALEVIF